MKFARLIQLLYILYGKFLMETTTQERARHPATSCPPNGPNGYGSLGQPNLA